MIAAASASVKVLQRFCIYADNEPKSVMVQDLGGCRDNG